MSGVSVDVKATAAAQIPCGGLSTCAEKVCKRVRRSGGGTSSRDVEAYMKTAASCGAEAACAAVGAGAAAPICGRVAAIATDVFVGATKKVVKKIGNVFTGGKSGARKALDALAGASWVYTGYIGILDHLRAEQWNATVAMHQAADEAVKAYRSVDPEGTWSKTDALLQMRRFGLPMSATWPALSGITVAIAHKGANIAQFHSSGRARDEGKGTLAPDFERPVYIAVAENIGARPGPVMKPRDALAKAVAASTKVLPEFEGQQAALEQWLGQLELVSVQLLAYAAESSARVRAMREARRTLQVPSAAMAAFMRVQENELAAEQRAAKLKQWAPWILGGTVAATAAGVAAYRQWR